MKIAIDADRETCGRIQTRTNVNVLLYHLSYTGLQSLIHRLCCIGLVAGSQVGLRVGFDVGSRVRSEVASRESANQIRALVRLVLSVMRCMLCMIMTTYSQQLCLR